MLTDIQILYDYAGNQFFSFINLFIQQQNSTNIQWQTLIQMKLKREWQGW